MHRHYKLSLSVVVLVFLSMQCFANKVKRFKISSPSGFSQAPEIEVYSSDGEKYTNVDKTDQSKVTIKTNIKCKYEGKGNKAYDGDLSVAGYVPSSGNSPSQHLIPHSDIASRVFRFENGKGQSLNPVKVCNEELQKRLSDNADKNRYQIMAKGFTVNYPAALDVRYRLQCKATGLGKSTYDTKQVKINTKYRCKASDLAKAKIPDKEPKRPSKRKTLSPVSVKALVKNVSFVANPAVQINECPASVSFVGHIQSSRKGTVKYRYIKHDGRESPLFKLEFFGAETRKTRKWSVVEARPNSSKQLQAPGQRKSKYEIQGYYKLIIESPRTKKQAKAEYKIDCDKEVGMKTLQAPK